jgi:hypothetical protein
VKGKIMKYVWYVVATLLGLLAGVLMIGAIEAVNSAIFAPDSPLDMNDPQAMKRFIAGLPTISFVVVAVAWGLGSFTASAIAKLITPNRRNLASGIVVAFFLLATLANLFAVPHPVWMWIAGSTIVPVAGALGICLVPSRPYESKFEVLVNAERPRVFETLADVEKFAKAVPGIRSVEMLSGIHRGTGTRFKETREMNGKAVSAELEVTEHVEGEKTRLVTEAAGTLWDTLFVASDVASRQTKLETKMLATPRSMLSRFTTPLMLGLVRKGIESDVAAIKQFCERDSSL